MEIQFLPFNFTTFLLFISFIFLLVKGWKKSNSLNKNIRLPPSPWKLPLVGNLHHLVGGLPHHSLRKLTAKYGPFIHLQLGEVSTIVISSRQIANNVLKVHDPACAGRPESIGMKIMWYNYTDIAFSPYNDYWRQMRKVCILELLSTKNVRSFGSIRVEEASRLIKSIQSRSGGPINLTEKIFSFNSSMTCRAAFGQVLRDKDTLIILMKEGAALAGGFELADFFPSSKLLQFMSWNKNRLWKMRAKLDSILDSIIDEHKDNLAGKKRGEGESLGENIVDVLLRLQQSEELAIPITNDNIKAIIFDLFSAGTETSSVTIDWAMAELMRNPDVMAKSQAEIRQVVKEKGTFEESDVQSLRYLKLVIKEALRMHPPFPLLARSCREECEVNGYIIPNKAKVMVNIWAMGRDPEYWDEPESFKPERFESNSIDFLGNNLEFIPFGAGKRFCPGMNFALANIELPLAQLLYHFNWKLPNKMHSNDLDMEEGKGLSVPRKNALYLIPSPYYSSTDR
ncbi:premnaspirodiene oxygenase-like [Olea europaea var. sylvestris]|uniref:Premnaspirodiene oxygenase-like n=1 Tax=Olea europaea subsp. europaea TaxID=158383 RepID=A0A8S0VH56_OLEEU|nr:premnaspirodiene oxygenase-like [Olea europaea var. sylvestris]CAA3031302.1 premnaspirodiene oxygenase-like [Olea europaea subsp. europaea]